MKGGISTDTIGTHEYVSVLREFVEGGKEVRIRISGSSMYPFLVDGRDYAFFKTPDRELKAGDIVFYQRAGGQYVLHRICRREGDSFFMAGDGQAEIEGPVRREQIFALVTHVLRDGKDVYPDDFIWKFYAGFWLKAIPQRLRLIKLYRILK